MKRLSRLSTTRCESATQPFADPELIIALSHFDKLPADAKLSTLISFISGILRVSTKYNIQVLRQKCIFVLQQKFPSTLAGCDGLLASQYQYLSSAVVRAIPLARETNVPEILPWAFYIATHISTDELLKDGVLSWRDKTLCLSGKERLWQAQKTLTHSFQFESTRAPQCTLSCTNRLPPAMSWRETEVLRISPHPLERYTTWAATNMCPKCLAYIEAQHQLGRKRVWEMLPSIFQLGSWGDISKDQNC